MEYQPMETADYRRIAEAIRYIEAHTAEQPDLEAVAARIGVSAGHLQRLFRRWTGISPKRFLQYLTAERARHLLQASESVFDASLEVGLSGGGRLHDLIVNVYAMTPGVVKELGAGLAIRYGVHASPFGPCIIATTPQGVCELAFAEPDEIPETLDALRARWPEATWTEDPDATAPVRDALFAPLSEPSSGQPRAPFMLHLKGTNFQIRVWEALLRIPPGQTTTYGAIARALGEPGASRAVGNAVGRNPVAALIPCHRVIRQSGALGGYRWGAGRKRALLAWEAAGLNAEPHDVAAGPDGFGVGATA